MGSSGKIDQLSSIQTEALTAGESTMPRHVVNTNTATLGSNAMRLTYFTALKSEAITQVRTITGGTAAGFAPTLCRVGIYSIAADLSGVLVQSVLNDVTLWAAVNTEYVSPLAGTFNKVAGQRYAVGLLIVTAAATPTFAGSNVILAGSATGGSVAARAPRLTSFLAGQADLPANFTDAAVAALASGYYVELVP